MQLLVQALSRVARLRRWRSGEETACQCGRRRVSGRVRPLGREDPLEEEMATCSFSGLENSLDRGVWLTTDRGVAQSWTWLNTHASLSDGTDHLQQKCLYSNLPLPLPFVSLPFCIIIADLSTSLKCARLLPNGQLPTGW